MLNNVIYLSAWLDCPDVILRRNYAMQDKINEARNYLFYKLREEGKNKDEAVYRYNVWIQKNRERIKIALDPVETIE